MSTTTTVTHPDGTTVTCTTTTVASPKKLVLKYWNGRGLMEVARQLLAVSAAATAAPPAPFLRPCRSSVLSRVDPVHLARAVSDRREVPWC